MKGLYYSFFLLRKNYFIYPAAAALLTMIAGCLMLAFAENENVQGFTIMLILLAPMICAMLPSEAICLDFDRSINTRFANYLLSGITPARFCNIELIKNLLVTAFSLVIICVCDLAFWLTNKTAMPIDMFMLHIMSIVIVNAGNWLLMPVVAKFRNADKAGLIVGLTLGVIAAPAIITALDDPDTLYSSLDILGKPSTLLIGLAVAAVIYALGYLIFYKTIKRGDIC